jgi:hypothetical protein
MLWEVEVWWCRYFLCLDMVESVGGWVLGMGIVGYYFCHWGRNNQKLNGFIQMRKHFSLNSQKSQHAAESGFPESKVAIRSSRDCRKERKVL